MLRAHCWGVLCTYQQSGHLETLQQWDFLNPAFISQTYFTSDLRSRTLTDDKWHLREKWGDMMSGPDNPSLLESKRANVCSPRTTGKGSVVSAEQSSTWRRREQKVKQRHTWIFLLVFEEQLIARIFLAKNWKKKKVGRHNVEYVRISEQMSKIVREQRQHWERSAGGR